MMQTNQMYHSFIPAQFFFFVSYGEKMSHAIARHVAS